MIDFLSIPEVYSEKECIDWLISQRNIDRCECGGKFYLLKSMACLSCSYCSRQIYPKAGTIFHRTYTPLVKWFYLIDIMSRGEVLTIPEIKHRIGVNHKTARRMKRKINKELFGK